MYLHHLLTPLAHCLLLAPWPLWPLGGPFTSAGQKFPSKFTLLQWSLAGIITLAGLLKILYKPDGIINSRTKYILLIGIKCGPGQMIPPLACNKCLRKKKTLAFRPWIDPAVGHGALLEDSRGVVGGQSSASSKNHRKSKSRKHLHPSDTDGCRLFPCIYTTYTASAPSGGYRWLSFLVF